MQRYLQVVSIQLDRSLAVLEGVAPVAEHDVGLCAVAVQHRQQLRQGTSHVQALCVETHRLSQVELLLQLHAPFQGIIALSLQGGQAALSLNVLSCR